jgi:hypothetical protein
MCSLAYWHRNGIPPVFLLYLNCSLVWCNKYYLKPDHLTPWNEVLIVTQLVKKSLPFINREGSLTVFTRAYHWSLSSVSIFLTCFSNIYSNILLIYLQVYLLIFPKFYQLLISSWMKFWFLTVPKYLNFASFSKDLLAVSKVVPVLFFNWAPQHEGLLGEWRYSSTHSLTSALDGVSGQLRAPVALAPGKEPLVPIG